MTFLHRYSIRHPLRVLVIAMLAVLATLPGLRRLKLRTDGYALVPAARPEVIFDRAVRREFNTEDLIVVLIRSDRPEGVFNADTLRLVQELTTEIQAIEGLEPYNVTSLQTEPSHRVKPGTLDFRPFLEPLPTTPEELDRLRGDLEQIELYTGTLVSDDGTAASILVGVPSAVDRSELYRQVQDLVAAHQPRPERIDVIGPVVAEALLGIHILEDLGVPRVLLGLRPPADQPTWRLPRSLYDLRLFIGQHIGLVPVAIVVMGLVFAASFRSSAASVLPLIKVGAGLLTIFGLMGWFNVPIYLTIAVMPVILTVTSVANEMHIFDRYVQELRAHPDAPHLESLAAAMDEMCSPVFKASVTTAVGFLSFALSPLAPVQAFGIFTSVGVMLCTLWSLTAVPAAMALLSPRRFVKPRPESSAHLSLGSRFFAWLGALVGRWRWAVLAAAVVVTVVAPFGAARVVIQDSWINGFAPESDFYQATQFFNRQFLGTHVLLVRVEAQAPVYAGEVPAAQVDHHQVTLPADAAPDPEALVGNRLVLSRADAAEAEPDADTKRHGPGIWRGWIESIARDGEHLVVTTERRGGSPVIALQAKPDEMIHYRIKVEPFLSPEAIRRVGELEAFLETLTQHTVGGVIGTASYLETTNFMSRGLREGTRVIPDSPDRIQWLWSQYQRIRGPERLQQVVDPDYAHSLVTVFLKNANFIDAQALMDAARAYEAEHLKPYGLSIGFAGDVAVSQTLIRAIVETQVLSVIGSLVGALAMIALLGWSLRWGLLSVLPGALAILINFAVMGWTGMPLGVATSMFAAMTLGIGDDYAIHLLERYRWARRRGLAAQPAITDAMSVTGPAIFIDALSVALGFGVLTLSQVPANARLGALLVLSILGCLVASLLLLPALLRLRSPRS